MKQFCHATFLFSLAAFLLTGCGREGSDHTAIGPGETDELELFNKSKGVRLPPEVSRSLDVAMAEVTQREVVQRFQKTARVYRAATAQTPASAMVSLATEEVKRMGEQPVIHLPRGGVTATLVRLENSLPATAGTMEALISFPDGGGLFPVGATVDVVFTESRPRTALGVPSTAIIDGAAGAFVYTANGEYLSHTPVKLGAVVDDWVEVTDGLYEGDMVAIKAADSLWLIELCALRGGTPCCPVEKKPKKN